MYLRGQVVCSNRLRYSLCAARIHGKHALDILMSRIIRLDARELFVDGWASGDFIKLDVFTRLLDRCSSAIHPRLDIELSRCSDKPGNVAFSDQVNNPLTYPFARLDKARSTVTQPLI